MTDRLAELGALQYAVENLSTAGTNPNRLGLAGYIHAAYTDYQTWAAANPGVNPNRLSARGRLYGYFYDNASWSPTSLFASGEQGAWYDPSDLTTMFQDRAGTTPVTADGQTVGKILDKSGRGNHAVAPSDAARPLYKTDGTYHWLQFDGVDDTLGTSSINLTSIDKTNFFIGVLVAGTTTQMPCCFGSSGNGRSDISYAGSSPIARAGLVGGSGGYAQISTPTSGAPPIKIVNTVLYDIAGSTATDEIKIRQNGVLGTQTVLSAGPAGTGNFGNHAVVLGDTNTATPLFPFNGNIYSVIFRAVTSTTDEITNTETWVNSKTGAY